MIRETMICPRFAQPETQVHRYSLAPGRTTASLWRCRVVVKALHAGAESGSVLQACCTKFPSVFGNRWKCTEINENKCNTQQHEIAACAITKRLKKWATPAGFEPATLSLEG